MIKKNQSMIEIVTQKRKVTWRLCEDRKKNRPSIIAFLCLTMAIALACEKSAKHEYYFKSKKNESSSLVDTIVAYDSIVITRLIERPSFILSSDVEKNESLEKAFLASVKVNNELNVYLQTSFAIAKSFDLDSVQTDIFRIQNSRTQEKLHLIGVYMSDLGSFKNSYDFIGKNFSDFSNTSIKRGIKHNNILMSASYDLSNIEDTVLVVNMRFLLKTEKLIKKVSYYDTIYQHSLVSTMPSVRVH